MYIFCGFFDLSKIQIFLVESDFPNYMNRITCHRVPEVLQVLAEMGIYRDNLSAIVIGDKSYTLSRTSVHFMWNHSSHPSQQNALSAF